MHHHVKGALLTVMGTHPPLSKAADKQHLKEVARRRLRLHVRGKPAKHVRLRCSPSFQDAPQPIYSPAPSTLLPLRAQPSYVRLEGPPFLGASKQGSVIPRLWLLDPSWQCIRHGLLGSWASRAPCLASSHWESQLLLHEPRSDCNSVQAVQSLRWSVPPLLCVLHRYPCCILRELGRAGCVCR
jgi:hypothetical protein